MSNTTAEEIRHLTETLFAERQQMKAEHEANRRRWDRLAFWCRVLAVGVSAISLTIDFVDLLWMTR